MTWYRGRVHEYFVTDSLRSLSSTVLISQALNAVVGFVFWLICARLYKTSDVGLAASMVGYATLVAALANLGLPNTLIRFLPTSDDRGGLVNAALCLVVAFSVAGGSVSLVVVGHFVRKLAFVGSSAQLSILLILLVSFTAVGALLDGVILAYRERRLILLKSVIANALKILLPVFLVGIALRGMIVALVAVLVVAVLFSLTMIARGPLHRERVRPNVIEVFRHWRFATGNFLGGIFGILPSTVVLLIILTRLGSYAAAYFYIPMQIGAFLGVIPSSTSQAMMSESSQTVDVSTAEGDFRKAFVHSYVVLLPAVSVACFGGWAFLRLYGADYARNGFLPLVVLSLSSLFVAINWLGDAWLNVMKRSRGYFLMNAFNALAVVVLVYVFSPKGLVMATLGWLLGQFASAIVYIGLFYRGGLLVRSHRNVV